MLQEFSLFLLWLCTPTFILCNLAFFGLRVTWWRFQTMDFAYSAAAQVTEARCVCLTLPSRLTADIGLCKFLMSDDALSKVMVAKGAKVLRYFLDNDHSFGWLALWKQLRLSGDSMGGRATSSTKDDRLTWGAVQLAIGLLVGWTSIGLDNGIVNADTIALLRNSNDMYTFCVCNCRKCDTKFIDVCVK